MGTKMTHTARAELTHAVRRRYSAATGADKRKILDEFIAVTGYHDKSAIRALNAEPVIKKPFRRIWRRSPMESRFPAQHLNRRICRPLSPVSPAHGAAGRYVRHFPLKPSRGTCAVCST